MRLGSWRIPTSALARAIVVLFAVLSLSLISAALYSGVAVALASLARVMLFGIAVYAFFYVTTGPGDVGGAFRSARILFLSI